MLNLRLQQKSLRNHNNYKGSGGRALSRRHHPPRGQKPRPAGAGSGVGPWLLLLVEPPGRTCGFAQARRSPGKLYFHTQTESLLFTHQTCVSGEFQPLPRLLDAGRGELGRESKKALTAHGDKLPTCPGQRPVHGNTLPTAMPRPQRRPAHGDAPPTATPRPRRRPVITRCSLAACFSL